MAEAIERRDYQIALKDQTYTAWNAGHKNVVCVMPTGAGKSILMSDIVLESAMIGMKQCVIAHRNELVSQMSIHIARRGIPHQIIGSDSTIAQIRRMHRSMFHGQQFVNPSAHTSVVGVNTLVSRKESLKKWAYQHDQWMGDEFHHFLRDNLWGKAVAMMPNARGLGVTATPIRADGQGLGRDYDGLADVMLIGPSMRELIKRNYLCDFEIVCPRSDLEVLPEEVSASGDWSNKTLRKAAKKSHIVGDVVENYLKYAPGRRAIVFATDVETSGEIAQKFRTAGINAASLSAETPTAVREKYDNDFKSGNLQVLVNVDLFDEGYDCLDSQTVVLTPNGWKNHLDISNEKECYAWNSNTGQCEIVPIEKSASRLTRDGEKILEIKSQHTDIRITEGHRVFYKEVNYYYHGKGLSKQVLDRKASDIYKHPKMKFALPLCGEHEFKSVDLTDDEIRILGWYMTDGNLNKDGSLEISQVKLKHVKNIRELLDRSGWEYSESLREVSSGYKTGIKVYRFRIPRRFLVNLSAYMDKKNPPKILHDMNREQFKILYSTMMDGNGSFQENKSGTLHVMHKGQADFITHAASVRGFASMYGSYFTENNVQMYTLRIREEKWIRLYQKDKRGAKFTFSQPENKELVWCVTNKLRTLITRRNGKVVILGNCPNCDVVIMARPTASLGKYKQQIGRGLRFVPGKVALIIDMVSNVVRHGLPDKENIWSLARREKRAKHRKDPDELPLIECKQCTKPYEIFRRCCPYCGFVKPLPEPRQRTLEMVEGDLILLDRAALEKLRQATKLDDPAEVQKRVAEAAGGYAGVAAYNKQIEKMATHAELKDTLAQWAGIQRAKGLSDSEIHSKLYHTMGVDMLTILSASNTPSEMHSLIKTIQGWWRK